MSKENRQFYEFGPFRIDTLNRQLRRDDQVVPLKAKAVDTLLLLIQNRGDVIEKDELMQRLWPDSFVEEANLTQNIYTLRKALGGDYIETLPRRGYRFIAEVNERNEIAGDVIVIQEKTRTRVSYEEESDDSADAQIADLAKNAGGEPRVLSAPKSNRRWVAVPLIGVIILIGGGVLWLRSRATPFTSVKLTKLTTTGKAVKATISPDGKYVAYVLRDAGQQSLWLRQMATGKELPIVPAQQTDYYGMTFTRDGNYIFYVSQEQNHPGILYQVPSLGGTPDKLIEDVDSPVTLAPDNRQLAFIRFGPGIASIVIANADGTGERTLASTHSQDAIRIGPNGVLPPSWSPDGKVIACPVSINSSQWDQTIYGYQIKDGAGQPLTLNHWPALGRIEWSLDGNGLLATVIESETSAEQQVWFVPYPKGEARRITNDLTDYRDLSVTADGRTLITIQSEKKANIWLAQASDLDHPTQLSATSYDGLNGMSWTPDGKLVYTSQIAGEQNLWVNDPKGGAPKQLTAHAGFSEQPAVSPDGRYIVFLSNRNGQEHLWRIDIDGKHPLELTHGASDSQPSFTTDGKSVVYRSHSTNGSNLFSISIDGGEPMRLTDKVSFDPNVSPDGKTIACAFRPEPTTTKIAILAVNGGAPNFISDLPACYGRLRWMADGAGVAYAARQAGVGNIWIQPLDGRAPFQLTHWNPGPIFSFDWSRDGKWLAYASGSLTSDVVLINDAGH